MGKSQKGRKKEKKDIVLENLEQGMVIYKGHPLFSRLSGRVYVCSEKMMGRKVPYCVNSNGYIYVNQEYLLKPEQWAYGIAHCLLHLAFGHFDAEKMPGYEIEKENGVKEKKIVCDVRRWNIACDLYIEKFLADIKFGESLSVSQNQEFLQSSQDEIGIYERLLQYEENRLPTSFMDMEGLENPILYKSGEKNIYATTFAYALAESVSDAVSVAGGHGNFRSKMSSRPERMSQWFINHYPLLGGIASAFEIINDYKICMQEDIQIAAIDVTVGKIYINSTAGLGDEELKFVLAHEFLHAGLLHHQRCQGRNPYLWNVACDYVINDWLVEMQIGTMPEQGLLYDLGLKNLSAETIYDKILQDIRRYEKMNTFRGYGKGDVIEKGAGRIVINGQSVPLDEFCKSALMMGLEYHESQKRGYIPAGLIDEIRALAMPPIPWEVELARWFESHFPDIEKKRSYARPSRRQASTPDIVRPRYVLDERLLDGRTFGVVVDTSGSVTDKMLAKALGSIASYAVTKEVPYVRVVFCDAAAYDTGYLAADEIAGRVEIKGRGGTVMQAGVDLLESAKDFSKKGPILIITDGWIEEKMQIHREHAFLIPKGRRLPFRTKGEVFYFE